VKHIVTKVLVSVLAMLLNNIIGIGIGNAVLPKYCHWYWH